MFIMIYFILSLMEWKKTLQFSYEHEIKTSEA